jgi:hypothetical protein
MFYSIQSSIVLELANHGGMMTKSDLARRAQMRLGELDEVLRELEHEPER